MAAVPLMMVVMMMMIATSFLMGWFINGVEAFKEEEAGIIHVGGRVLCQDCTHNWKEWVQGANPIKGSKVSITCMDNRKRAVYYASDETDENGDFEMKLNKYYSNYGKELDPKNCWVRLVSSSDPVCNIATGFGGGRSGVRLRRPTVVYRDTVKYLLKPFYYTTPMCDQPDTSVDSEEPGSKY